MGSAYFSSFVTRGRVRPSTARASDRLGITAASHFAHACQGPTGSIGFQAPSLGGACAVVEASSWRVMAAKSLASRLRGSRRLLSGFVAGAVVGAAGTGLIALQFFRSRDTEATLTARELDGECLGHLGPRRPPPPTGAAMPPVSTARPLATPAQAVSVPAWACQLLARSRRSASVHLGAVLVLMRNPAKWVNAAATGSSTCL